MQKAMIKFEKLPPDILARLPSVKEVLAEDRRIIFAYLFGGLASGKIAPLSDIDIAVYLSSMENLGEYKLDLFDRLSNALCADEIDLVILNAAPESIAGRVLQKKQLLADKEPFLRHDYESLTLRKFYDFSLKEAMILNKRYKIGQ